MAISTFQPELNRRNADLRQLLRDYPLNSCPIFVIKIFLSEKNTERYDYTNRLYIHNELIIDFCKRLDII